MPDTTPATPAPSEAPTSAKKATAVEAVGPTSVSCYTGEVLTFEVRSEKKPDVVSPEGNPLYVSKTPRGTWAGSWAALEAGEHAITASAVDAEPATFTVTATDKEA